MHDRCCSEDHDASAGPKVIEAVQTADPDQLVTKAILSLDNLGIFASALCLVHCMAMPFVIALLPVLGLEILDSHESHLVLGSFIWAFALFAIVPGYLKHRNVRILIGMCSGLALVSFAVLAGHQLFGERGELICLTAGNLTLVAVHWKNRGLFSKCCEGH